MSGNVWHYYPRLRTYTFYDRREQFVRTRSTFQEWVVIGVETGAFDYDTGKEQGHALPGDLIFCAPHQSLWRSATVTPFTYHVLQWSFVNESGQKNAEVWKSGKWHVRDVSRLMNDYVLLQQLYNQSDEFTRRRIENLLEDILMMAWATRSASPEVQDPTMRKAIQLLRERAGEPFSMAEVSSEVGLSPVQFTRRFRAAQGVTPIEFLTRLRLEMARKFLIDSDNTLDEVARYCGWSSGYYLSSVFKKAFGMAPGKFRRIHRV